MSARARDPVRCILLIEDEPSIAHSVIALLETCLNDIKIVHAEDKAAALEASAQPFDLILSDYALPDGNGLDVLKHFSDVQPQARRMLMTAFGDTDLAMRVLEGTLAHAFFVKPFEPDELLHAVEGMLDGVAIER